MVYTKKSRELNERLIAQVRRKAVARGDITKFTFNFLTNFERSYRLYNFVKGKTKDDELILLALSQHIVSLIGICETFFRDVFVFLSGIDEHFASRIVEENGLRLSPGGTSAEMREVLSDFFSFQRIADLEIAFKPLIGGRRLFETIGNIVVPFYCHTDETVKKFCLNTSITDWQQLFSDVLAERHDITHDANFRTKMRPESFNEYHRVLFYFPQIFALWVSTIYRLPIYLLHTSEQGDIPYIFALDDLRDDWQIV